MDELNFLPFPVFVTERLKLQRIKPEDEKDIFALRNNESVHAFLDRPIAKTVAEARQSIHKMNDGIADKKWITWAIVLKETNKVIGTICLWNFTKADSKTEIGYELLPIYQGQGLLQEAMVAVLGYGFKNIALNSIEAVLHPDNRKSIQLLEKNGFVKEESNKIAARGDKDVMVVYTLRNLEYVTLSISE